MVPKVHHDHSQFILLTFGTLAYAVEAASLKKQKEPMAIRQWPKLARKPALQYFCIAAAGCCIYSAQPINGNRMMAVNQIARTIVCKWKLDQLTSGGGALERGRKGQEEINDERERKNGNRKTKEKIHGGRKKERKKERKKDMVGQKKQISRLEILLKAYLITYLTMEQSRS